MPEADDIVDESLEKKDVMCVGGKYFCTLMKTKVEHGKHTGIGSAHGCACFLEPESITK